MPIKSSDIMFWKRDLHKNVHKYVYIHMRKALFEGTINEFGIGITNPFFWIGAYRVLEKKEKERIKKKKFI